MRHLLAVLGVVMVLVVPAGAAEERAIDTVVYFGFSGFDSEASKQRARYTGLYASLGQGLDHRLEGELDFTDIDYREGSSLRQWDLTLVYSNAAVPGTRLRFGTHLLKSGDGPTDGGLVVFAGGSYGRGRWHVGLDAYASRYRDYESGLDVLQVTPRLSGELWSSADAGLGVSLKGYWIRLGEDVGLRQRSFTSMEPALTLRAGRVSGSLYARLGSQAFAVVNDGFTLYNLAEEHRTGFGGALRLAVSTRTAFTLRAARESYDELAADRRVHSLTFVLLAGHSF